MVELGDFRNTNTSAVTSVAADYAHPNPYPAVMVRADVNVCLAIGRDATTDDFVLVADEYALITLDHGSSLSFICADGEADGTILITECTGAH